MRSSSALPPPPPPPPPPPLARGLADDHGNQSSEGSSSTPVAVECFVCGRRFDKEKALFGHMKSHPEREWRGVRPEPGGEGSGRTRKRRRRKMDPENQGERVAEREGYVWGDCRRAFGSVCGGVMASTEDAEVAPAGTEGGGSRHVSDKPAWQFAVNCGLQHHPRMQCRGKMEKGKGAMGSREEMVAAKPQRGERRGCLVDLNLPPPVDEEQEDVGEKKIRS